MPEERRKEERRRVERRVGERRKENRGNPDLRTGERRKGDRRKSDRRKSERRKIPLPSGLGPETPDTSLTLRHRFIQTNGIRLHLAEAGPEKPGPGNLPVLMLHGFPELWYSWRHQLAALGEKFRAVAPDLRGYGQSEIPAGGYDTFTLAADVAGLIDELGGRVHLVGHDWGGLVAWHVALEYPERVASLAVLAAPHPVRYWEVFWSSARQFKMSLYVLGFQIPFVPEWRMSRKGGEFLAATLERTAPPGTFTAADLKIFRQAWSRRDSMRAGVNYYREALRGYRSAQKFYARRQVQCPGLVIWGARDFALSLDLTEKLERFFVTPPRIEILPDCGHWVQQEAPAEVNRLLLEFLKRKD